MKHLPIFVVPKFNIRVNYINHTGNTINKVKCTSQFPYLSFRSASTWCRLMCLCELIISYKHTHCTYSYVGHCCMCMCEPINPDAILMHGWLSLKPDAFVNLIKQIQNWSENMFVFQATSIQKDLSSYLKTSCLYVTNLQCNEGHDSWTVPVLRQECDLHGSQGHMCLDHLCYCCTSIGWLNLPVNWN